MAEHLHFKDHSSEWRTFRSRLWFAAAVVLLLLLVLVTRFYYLQVVRHADYITLSERNRVHVQPLPPGRGLIYDRNGVLLADNRPSFTLSIIKEHVPDLDATLATLAELVALDDEDLNEFRERLAQRSRPYQAVPLRFQLTEAEIAALAVNEYRLPGVDVEALPVRHYPQGALFAHSVGYVGRISERELRNLDPVRYSGTHTIGKVGVEKSYEALLLGEVGSQNVETNARGRVLRVLERTNPQPGANLTLHLDSHLQQVATEALGDRRGAVVAMDVRDGAVRVLVSKPSFNPNLFVTGISVADYRALADSHDLPLYNRTVLGQYPPASTIKPMLGLAGLHYGVVDPEYSINDPGFYQLENDERIYRDWKREGHGPNVDLHQAIVESCDTYYYDMAFKMGIDRIAAFSRQFGMGQRTGIDLPNERAGLMPSRPWKRQHRRLPWFPGDTVNIGIGQGDWLVTPVQLVEMTAALANRGRRFQPQLLAAINGEPVPPKPLPTVETRDEHWQVVMAAMEDVVHGLRGTAQGIRRGLEGYRIAGKTGTAQVIGIPQDEEYNEEEIAERKRDHALFVAYAPADTPELAVAVIVENGGHGSSAAAPIARALYDAYFAAPAKTPAANTVAQARP